MAASRLGVHRPLCLALKPLQANSIPDSHNTIVASHAPFIHPQILPYASTIPWLL